MRGFTMSFTLLFLTGIALFGGFNADGLTFIGRVFFIFVLAPFCVCMAGLSFHEAMYSLMKEVLGIKDPEVEPAKSVT